MNRHHQALTRRQFLHRGISAITGVSAASMLGVYLASCRRQAPAEAPTPEPAMQMTPVATPALSEATPGTAGEVNLLLGSHMEPVLKIVQMYRERYGIEPKTELITTPDLQTKVTGAFLARSSPWDSIFVTAALVVPLADQDWLESAEGFINERVRPVGDLLERGLGAAVHQGDIYAVPWAMGCPILHWNKQMLANAGLDPEAPATWHQTKNSWDSFVDYAKKMTGTRNGEQVYGYTDAWAGDHVLWTWGGVLQMHGGRWFDEDFQPAFNSEAGIAATEKLYDLLRTHNCVDPAVTTYTWVFDALPAYLNGTRGMFISWPFVAGVANGSDDSKIQGQSGFAPNPAVETSASVDGSEFFGVPVYAKNKEDAWRFIELVTSREGQRLVAEGGWAGIFGDLMEEPDILQQFPFYTAIRKSYDYPVDGGWSPHRPEWVQILATEIHEVLGQKKKPKEALNDAAKRIVALRG